MKKIYILCFVLFTGTAFAENTLRHSASVSDLEMRVGFDESGFNSEGIHKDTGTLYAPNGFNQRGFNSEGIHKDTGTTANPEGFDKEGNVVPECEGTYLSVDYHNRHHKDVTIYRYGSVHFRIYDRHVTSAKNPNDASDPYTYYQGPSKFFGLVGSDLHYRNAACRKIL